MSFSESKKLDLIFKLLIGVDLIAMLVIFIHARVWPEFPFPHLGTKLNNSFIFLLILLILRVCVNPDFRGKQISLIKKITTEEPIRLYFFSLLLLVELGLEIGKSPTQILIFDFSGDGLIIYCNLYSL